MPPGTAGLCCPVVGCPADWRKSLNPPDPKPPAVELSGGHGNADAPGGLEDQFLDAADIPILYCIAPAGPDFAHKVPPFGQDALDGLAPNGGWRGWLAHSPLLSSQSEIRSLLQWATSLR